MLALILDDSQGRELERRTQPLITPYALPDTWPLGKTLRGRVELTLPPQLDPWDYRLRISVYRPSTDQRLRIERTNGLESSGVLRLDDPRAVASYLNLHTRPDEAIIVAPDRFGAFGRFYTGSASWWEVNVGTDFARGRAVVREVLAKAPRRVWLAHWRPEFTDPTDLLVTELLRVGRPVPINQQFVGYEVLAFDIPATHSGQSVRPAVQEAPGSQHPQNLTFTGGLRLNGYDVLDADDGTRRYVFCWQADRPLERNYSLALQVLDPSGHEYLRLNKALVTDAFMPAAWPLRTPVCGRADLLLPADLPPQVYQVLLKVFDPIAQQNLDVLDRSGQPQEQTVPLEQVALTKAALNGQLPPIPHRIDARLGRLILLGFDGVVGLRSAGQRLPLSLWWQKEQGSGNAQTSPASFQVRLVNANGQIAWTEEFPLIAGYQASAWPAGEINRVVVEVTLPASLVAGNYTLQAGMEGAFQNLGVVQVQPLARLAALPPTARKLDARLESIALLGYDVSPDRVQPGGALVVNLYWTTDSPLVNSYKATVQLLDRSGNLIAQDDSIPARWTRPTTGWLPGEIVPDAHALALPQALPDGPLTLIAALYDERTLVRLPASGAATEQDRVRVAVIDTQP